MIINFDQRYISGINHVLEFLNGVMPRVMDKRHFIGCFFYLNMCVSRERGEFYCLLVFISSFLKIFRFRLIPHGLKTYQLL